MNTFFNLQDHLKEKALELFISIYVSVPAISAGMEQRCTFLPKRTTAREYDLLCW